MESRIIDLEARFSHHDASIEELTRTVLKQQTQIEKLSEELEQIKSILRDLSSPNLASEKDETPPPHY